MKTNSYVLRGTWPLAFLLLLSILNAQLSTALAQGTAFTYQGRLNDGANPAHGTYDFRFKLFVDVFGNTQAGSTVLTNGVPMTNGLFTVTIDFGTGIFNGSNYWLEVDVRTNGGGSYANLIPLQSVMPSPYAIFANTASNLSGTISSANLSGAYGGAISFSNSGNSFSGSFNGNGSNVTNVNAATLGGLGANQLWRTGGNSNTVAGANFVGTADNQPLELRVNGIRALRIEPNTNGAPNIIGGAPVNFVDPGIVGATIGGGGTVSGNFYLGAGSNHVSAIFGTIAGGRMHTVAADHAFIGGGISNTVQAAAYDSVIGGGVGNLIQTNAAESVLVGGTYNSIRQDAIYSFLGGGSGNSIQANANYSFLGGGAGNSIQAKAIGSVLGGGSGNSILANSGDSILGGGSGNSIGTNAPYSVIEGGFDNSILPNANNSVIGGGGFHIIQTNANYSVIAGGWVNTVQLGADLSAIGGGYGNVISASQSTISGGIQNNIGSYSSTIGGGQQNTVGSLSPFVTIAGGQNNFASAWGATVGGGISNSVYAYYGAVSGGSANSVFGLAAMVPGGSANVAVGSYSFAAGQQAYAGHNGAFVWADSQNAQFSSTANDQFNVRANGGVRFITGGAGMTLDGQPLLTSGALSDVAFRTGGNAFTGQQTVTGGSVGIGTSSPQAALHVRGADAAQFTLQNSADNSSWYFSDDVNDNLVFQPNTGMGAYISRDGNYHVNSDVRLKRDITSLSGVLERVLQMRPVSYRFRSASSEAPPTLGLIAQEVEPLFPEVVGERAGMKSLAYSELVPVTIRAIQELNQKLETDLASQRRASVARDAEIQKLEKQNENLVQRLERLEKLLPNSAGKN